jgi:tRNA threonylcarbamoyladenosine biosynthesis protein TsaE
MLVYSVAPPMTARRGSNSAAETEALGAELAATLKRGDVVLVEGDLGAGKTTFVRGACRALGVRSIVTSPTFTIGQRYGAPVPVSHVDLFRVSDLQAEDPDLLDEYVGADAIVFVEWPQGAEEALAGLGHIAARVRLEHAGGDARTVEIE